MKRRNHDWVINVNYCNVSLLEYRKLVTGVIGKKKSRERERVEEKEEEEEIDRDIDRQTEILTFFTTGDLNCFFPLHIYYAELFKSNYKTDLIIVIQWNFLIDFYSSRAK